jgi:deoxyadenosine/deoxycytidine kinase
LSIPYKYIAVEGNIGAGKTTFSKKLALDLNARLILEAFSDNPFLPFFYEDPERYAFPVELFFMTERHKQLQADLGQKTLFQDYIVSDYYFFKTLLFAKNNLSEEEYRLFQRLFHILNGGFPDPDILVYLHRPVPELMKNIQRRGRNFETEISPDYLQQIQSVYLEFFKHHRGFPILILELRDVDFVASPEAYQKMAGLLQRDFSPGVHLLDFKREQI